MKELIKKQVGVYVGVCILAISTIVGVVSAFRIFAMQSDMVALNDRITQLDVSIEEGNKEISDQIGKLTKAVSVEESKNRAGMRNGFKSLDSRFDKSFGGVGELLSDMSKRMDAYSRQALLRAGQAGEVEGISIEDAALLDSSLAELLSDADKGFASGDFLGAAAKYSTILKSIPSNSDIRQKHAVSLFRANPADSANYSYIERELAISNPGKSDNVQVLNVLAMIAIERQQWDKALGYFASLISIDPKDATALKQAGECALYGGYGKRALDYLERAAVVDPGDKDIDALKARAREVPPSKEAR
jgi:tetratricopeptide (TPR) repeat protein